MESGWIFGIIEPDHFAGFLGDRVTRVPKGRADLIKIPCPASIEEVNLLLHRHPKKTEYRPTAYGEVLAVSGSPG